MAFWLAIGAAFVALGAVFIGRMAGKSDKDPAEPE
jgi:hypothetical protein